MRITYNEFINSLYEVGSEITISNTNFFENESVYRLAQREGYIQIIPMYFNTQLVVLKEPKGDISDELISAYYS